MPRVIILSGIPTSGKSTFAKECGFPVISCDEIRNELFGKNYKQNKKDEKLVWESFYNKIQEYTTNFVIDNTNCKMVYITNIIQNLNKEVSWVVEIKKFDVSLWRAYYRNLMRYLKTGKWIPIKVINTMSKKSQ